MLVQYTSISELSPADQQALKNTITGLKLEGRGNYFEFAGKVLKMSELIAAQRVWEQQRRVTGQLLQEHTNQHSL